jgi:hypothetical protein
VSNLLANVEVGYGADQHIAIDELEPHVAHDLEFPSREMCGIRAERSSGFV